ncbi:MAG: hypothetical protein LBM13_06320 [Candidatus Ancillula sp.]|jgi:capsular polysaccharide biosynthesis protein|nr:hypothetical protein [Candidatus Ancillula sp.]
MVVKYFKCLRKWLVSTLLIAIGIAAITFGYLYKQDTSEQGIYSASSRMVLYPNQKAMSDKSDIENDKDTPPNGLDDDIQVTQSNIESQMTNIIELVTSDEVMEKVIKNLDLDLTPQELSNEISAINESSSILVISASNSVPEDAAKIANETATVFKNYLETTGMFNYKSDGKDAVFFLTATITKQAKAPTPTAVSKSHYLFFVFEAIFVGIALALTFDFIRMMAVTSIKENLTDDNSATQGEHFASPSAKTESTKIDSEPRKRSRRHSDFPQSIPPSIPVQTDSLPNTDNLPDAVEVDNQLKNSIKPLIPTQKIDSNDEKTELMSREAVKDAIATALTKE